MSSSCRELASAASSQPAQSWTVDCLQEEVSCLQPGHPNKGSGSEGGVERRDEQINSEAWKTTGVGAQKWQWVRETDVAGPGALHEQGPKGSGS